MRDEEAAKQAQQEERKKQQLQEQPKRQEQKGIQHKVRLPEPGEE